MESYEIDFNQDIKIKGLKEKFVENGFLHLKNILDVKELEKIKENILNEFENLDNNANMNEADKKTLNRCEMPVTHDNCPRIDINSFCAHINSKLPEVLNEIYGDEFLWRFPPQIRRLTVKKDIGLLPYHQDYFYNSLYENIIVCWTPLVDCGKDAPSIELIRKTLTHKIEHLSNEIWEFGIPEDIMQEYQKNYETVSLKDVHLGDVVIFDAYNLHRTYWEESMDKTRYSIDLRSVKKSLISKELLASKKFIQSDNLKFLKEDNG